jgi:hypothetical protein
MPVAEFLIQALKGRYWFNPMSIFHHNPTKELRPFRAGKTFRYTTGRCPVLMINALTGHRNFEKFLQDIGRNSFPPDWEKK